MDLSKLHFTLSRPSNLSVWCGHNACGTCPDKPTIKSGATNISNNGRPIRRNAICIAKLKSRQRRQSPRIRPRSRGHRPRRSQEQNRQQTCLHTRRTKHGKTPWLRGEKKRKTLLRPEGTNDPIRPPPPAPQVHNPRCTPRAPYLCLFRHIYSGPFGPPHVLSPQKAHQLRCVRVLHGVASFPLSKETEHI